MPPGEFYQIEKNAYILALPKEPGTRKQPEEEVRQWCAYELIRAYGIRVTEMEFERAVRTGSRNHFIDILVSREGRPWSVIECKARGKGNLERGMKQAISYANALEPQPLFAVYTDGDEWLVRRLIDGDWVPVPDIPPQFEWKSATSLEDVLELFDRAAPIIHKLGEHLKGKEAKRFIRFLQGFFNGSNLLTLNIDRDLLTATDNVLRVLWTADKVDDDNYRRSKLATANLSFYTYAKKRGLGFSQDSIGNQPLHVEIRYLYYEVSGMMEGFQDLDIPETLVIKLNLLLLGYGRLMSRESEDYPELPSALHESLRRFINVTLASNLNTTLPETWDTQSNEDLKHRCEYAWNVVEEDNELTGLKFFGTLTKSLIKSFIFWKN